MVSELQLVRTDCVLARTAGVRTAYLLRTAYCVLCTAYCVLSIPGRRPLVNTYTADRLPEPHWGQWAVALQLGSLHGPGCVRASGVGGAYGRMFESRLFGCGVLLA